MMLTDDTGRVYTLPRLHEEWKQFRSEDPVNHASSFSVELFEILMATVNGRNDCDIVGMTPRELSDYIITLRKKVM